MNKMGIIHVNNNYVTASPLIQHVGNYVPVHLAITYDLYVLYSNWQLFGNYLQLLRRMLSISLEYYRQATVICHASSDLYIFLIGAKITSRQYNKIKDSIFLICHVCSYTSTTCSKLYPDLSCDCAVRLTVKLRKIRKVG